MAQSHQHLHRRHAKRLADGLEVLVKRDPAPEPQTTVLSVVYVTASPTFSGSVAGYTTIGVDSSTASSDTEPQTQVGEPLATSSIVNFSGATSSVESADSARSSTSSVARISSPSSFSTISSESFATSALATGLLTSTAAVSQLSTASDNTAVAAASATAASQASSSSSSGLSTGAKIGIAVGVIILLIAVAGGILIAYWKKKKEHEEYAKQDDEKAALAATAAAAAANKSPSPAPRLSLRPMSRLMRLSGGNLLNSVNTANGAQNGTGRNLTPSPNMSGTSGPRANSAWDRRVGGGSETTNNPFNDPQNPFSDPEKGVAPPVTTVGMAAGAGAAGAVGIAAVAGAAATKSGNNEIFRTGTPEPMAGGAAAGSPDAASNVHRVQLDFKPSMDDELELKAGQLVRMLHEYDDGWALCIRLDRSQQGVAPRTCLSPKPCKPRPAAGPNNAGPRGPGMNGPPNGRMSPAMGPPNGRMSPAMGPPNGRMSPATGRPGPPQARPMSPAGARGPPRMAPQHSQNNSSASINQFNQGPRPLSPGPGPRGPATPRGQRSQSPGPYGANQGPRSMAPPNQRRRSNSAGGVLMPQGRMSPAPLNPSRLNPGAANQWPLSTAGGRLA
jgi:cbb3-type cytochrome oxidase subunit 3